MGDLSSSGRLLYCETNHVLGQGLHSLTPLPPFWCVAKSQQKIKRGKKWIAKNSAKEEKKETEKKRKEKLLLILKFV
jgi:hypothetical protein